MNPTEIAICGVGAVSPAGWGVEALRGALSASDPEPLPITPLPRPPRQRPLRHRPIPPPASRPAWMAHPRLRRASSISHAAVAAAWEALGIRNPQDTPTATRSRRLGIVVCVMSGSVIYSRRFFDEVLKSPATASPVLFPETVYNAPASHLAAMLGADGINYTLVGDPSVFLAGLGIAAGWLREGDAEAALVVGVEETDWLTAEAWELFGTEAVATGGAGALLLEPAPPGHGVFLDTLTDRMPYASLAQRPRALHAARLGLGGGGVTDPGALLIDSRSGSRRYDLAETAVWSDWSGPVRSPKRILGEGFAAGGAWQCVLAAEALRRGEAREAVVSVAGLNEAAACARFRCGSGTFSLALGSRAG